MSIGVPNIFPSRLDGELVIRTGHPYHGIPKRRALVVGGGVTGLTSAWAMLDAGYHVTVVSERWADPKDRITSQIAGALWEWPPAVCGKHTDPVSLQNSKRWCMTSYRIFEKLQEIMPASDYLDHGVRMKMANFFFDKVLEDMPDKGQLYKFEQILAQPGIKGVRRDSILVREHGAPDTDADAVDAYQHLSPVIDTDAYMYWLRLLLLCKGAVLETRRISGDLLWQEEELLTEYDADFIINATGLASLELAGDPSVYPLRGALIRVVNDGVKFPKVTEALAVTHDDTHGEDEDIVFIVPRNDDTLILGGLAQPHHYKLDLTLSSPEVQRMRARCNKFVPGLENAEYDAEAPLVQGLRPFRGSNVRVERELRRRQDGSRSRIVHSYGQGGAGFSLSFGCAGDVLELVHEIECDMPAKTMGERLKLQVLALLDLSFRQRGHTENYHPASLREMLAGCTPHR
ncbi:nucleotide-binding domain-containing protein [Cylindrobasidium torrendii FP15055 ss-10]|uniref:Nucleotide-binding domain-containing protein n=1 Tax=Cylindrobasidium torrendii FP15055 ss-10 TaxID=1314674 RepID=A0A0D7B7I9_9AGAR|nr:nucleotide-binding domain-containing protein [Cylindrobasidium torrendii FP15055 ss-10]